jgi:hypothetical protein
MHLRNMPFNCGGPLTRLICVECDSLADGEHRRPRDGNTPCECKDGWGGINCNGTRINSFSSRFWSNMYYLVCKTDDACTGFPLAGGIESSFDDSTPVNMTCYKGGQTVFNNHQMCDVTSTFFLIVKIYLLF